MFYSDGKLAVAQIPKAGLRSIRAWLGPEFRVVDNDEARKAETRVMFIRNPFERPKSAYSMFRALSELSPKPYAHLPLDNWQVFVDYFLAHDDEHWLPQTEMVGDVPNRIHRFEHINSYVDQYKPGYLPIEGHVTRLTTDDYRADEIAEYYAADYAAWLQA